MNSKVKGLVVVVSLAAVLFIVAGGLGVHAKDDSPGAYRQLGVYTEVLQRIRSEYVEEPDFDAVRNGALQGLVESLDSSSSYLNPKVYQSYKSGAQERQAGVGVTVAKRFGFAAVVAVVPGSPAERAGLVTGDVIESLEGRSTRDLSLAEVQQLLTGEKGSTVKLSVVRPRQAEPQKLVLAKDVLTVPAVEQKMLEGNIGYLRPGPLTAGRAKDIAARVKQLESNGARSLILDLRSTAEGEFSEAVAVADLFLDQGLITYLQGQTHRREEYKADPAKTVTKLPMVALVNRGTAGPAEVVAAALQDNNRAELVGDKTFGLAAMQKLIEIQDGSAIIISVAKYYTPNGKAIQDTPIAPRVLVPDIAELESADDDEETGQPVYDYKAALARSAGEQLKKAVGVLRARSS